MKHRGVACAWTQSFVINTALFLTAILFGIPPVTAGGMSTPVGFNVNETGAATLNIPIEIPPGTAGIAPSLSLNYNSQGGNGLLGMGWSLSGLSAIYRCGRTLIQDGVKDGVNYNSNDKYCLDGQRLVAVSGAYGANNTEYRTERESFTKIISYDTAGSGPLYFKAWTKAGQIIEFGNSTDSRIEAQGKTDVRVWAANKISDTQGNYFTVSYQEENPNGDYRPNRIDYTGNTGAELATYNSVRFVYQTRTDITPMYQAGSLTKTMQRLANVQTYANVSGTDTLVKDYRLVYDISTATQRSRLTSVTECAGSGACLPATTVGWQDGEGVAFSSASYTWQSPNGYGSNGYVTQMGDFNGDGKTDIYAFRPSDGTHYVWLNQGNGTFLNTYQWVSPAGYGSNGGYSPRLGDFNGDGKADIYSFRPSDGTHYVWLNQGNGTFANNYQWVSPAGYGSSGGYSPQLGDFNGDGKMDIYAFRPSDGTHYVWLNQGNGTFANNYQWVSQSGYGVGYTAQLGDFNGDGKTDIYMFSSSLGHHIVWLNDGNGSFPSSSYTWRSPGGYGVGYTTQLGDFNGDGKTDIYMFSSSLGSHIVWLNDGNGSFQSSSYTWQVPNGHAVGYPAQLGDFNGDGKTDIYMFSSSLGHHIVWLNDGNGSFSSSSYTWRSPGGYGVGYTAQLGDFNGDGKTDIYMFSSSLGSHVTWLNYPPFPDLLALITTGLNTTTSLAYKPITDSTVYTKDTTAVYPYLDLQAPIYVVSSATVPNGIGGTRSTSYKYFGAKSHLTGGGFLGFRQFDVTDNATGIKSSTVFRQDYPYQGLPTSVTQTQPNSSVLKSVTNTWGFDTYTDTVQPIATATGSKHHFPKLTATQEKTYELTGTQITQIDSSTTYDAYGNATQVSVTSNDGYNKTTTNTYTNDLVNWYLGRLTRSTVTSTAPTAP